MSLLARFDDFHDQAARATGLSDFGPADYREPLRLVLSDYDAHARFSPFGRQWVEGNIVGLLANRLALQHGLAVHPHVLDTPIERPIVIIGTMRSGSTALHRLLAADPEIEWLPPWLAAAPMPRPPRDTWPTFPAYHQVGQGLEALYTAAPGFRAMHPMAADLPDECRFANDASFWSPGLACLATAPNYAAWCFDGDARYAYRRHRQVLQLISSGRPRPWVLKDPCHLWGLDALLDTYPDACVVWTHREPVGAMVSAATLFAAVRGAIEPLPREQMGREEMHLWAAALAKAERVRRQHEPSQFFDVHMDEVRAAPLDVAERLHRHFGLPLTPARRESWARYLASQPDAGHVRAPPRAEDLGFTRDDVYGAIGFYAERWECVARDAAERGG